MSYYYLLTDGAKLVKSGEKLQLKKEKDILHTIFPHKTDQIVIIGNIDITTPALKLIMKHHIDTVFVSKNGRFNGKLEFQKKKNVFLRLKQYKLYEDEKFKLEFARSIVIGKLKNQLTFLQRLGRRKSQSVAVKPSVDGIKKLIEKAENADSVESLRGYEGMGSKYYFKVFSNGIIPKFAKFNGRSMHPPKDNVNAVLSFLYTILFYRVDGLLEAEDLDPYIGFFHTLDYGKRTLAFDLMEEYRTPLCDMLTVTLFNLGILKEEDFIEVIFSPENIDFPAEVDEGDEKNIDVFGEKIGVLLSRDGIKKVIKQFEKKLETGYIYQPLNRKLSYKEIIHQQIKHFKRVVSGEEQSYKPIFIR